jgi:4-amino-4-deoxy-L-arabinose transferase-like glycosyltransferase
MQAEPGVSPRLDPPAARSPSAWQALCAYFSPSAISIRPLVLLALGLHLLLWTLLTGVSHSAPDADNMEQLVWGNVLQWGYQKHPPLPSWVIHALASVFGRQVWITFFAAQLSVTLAFYFIWRLGCEMTSPRKAFIAVLLTMPIAYFTTRGVMSNHNTLQLWSIAGALWMFYRAWRWQNLRDWLLLGMFCGFAVLTKYSVGVWFLVFALQLLLTGSLRDARTWKGVAAGAAVLVLMVLPHALWLYDVDVVRHDPRNPLHYALFAGRFESNSRLQNLVALYYMLTTNLARIAPMLVALLVIGGLLKRARWHASRAAGAAPDTPTARLPKLAAGLRAQDRRFILFIALAPFVLTSAGALVTDSWIIADWTTTFFIPAGLLTLWLFADTGDDGRKLLRTSLVVIATIQLITVVGYALARGPVSSALGRPGRSNYPGEEVSEAMQHIWRAHVDTPLRYITADTWLGGNIAIYAGRQAQVVLDGDPLRALWINPERVKACGTLVAIDRSSYTDDRPSREVLDAMPKARWHGTVQMPATSKRNGPQLVIEWGIIEPAGGCEVKAAK